MSILLHIILETPPTGIDFGLQKGSGSKDETVQTQRSGSDDLHFDLAVEIKGDPKKDPLPKFAGPFAQGKRPDNVLYIDIGTLAGQADSWSRRLKIPLSGIAWEVCEQVAAHPSAVLECRGPGTGTHGGPNCATVKPFGGWKPSF
jgi:hypothetical protein